MCVAAGGIAVAAQIASSSFAATAIGAGAAAGIAATAAASAASTAAFVAQQAAQTFTFANFLSQAGGFLFSPQGSALTQMVGLGVSLLGRQQQIMATGQEYRLREAALLRQQTLKRQEQLVERDRQEQRIRLIGGKGKQLISDARVEAAGRGVLVDAGSEADKTQEIAAEIALEKLLSQNDSDHRLRNLEIAAQDAQASIGLLGLEFRAETEAFKTEQQTEILTSAGKLASRFRFDKGDNAFRFRT